MIKDVNKDNRTSIDVAKECVQAQLHIIDWDSSLASYTLNEKDEKEIIREYCILEHSIKDFLDTL